MQSESSVSATEDDSPEAFETLVRQQVGDWSKFTSTRKPSDVRPLRKILGKNCLFWGLSTSQTIHQPIIARLLQLKSKPASQGSKRESANGTQDATAFSFEDAVTLWMEADSPSVGHYLQGVAWAHALPQLTHQLNESQWFALLDSLVALTSSNGKTSAVVRFLCEVEIPLAVAHVLPRLAACKALRKSARAKFEHWLDELLDGQGTPHARDLVDIQLLLASCVRSLAIDAESKKGRIPKSGRLHFVWLTQQAIRWARPDGSHMLTTDVDSPYFDELLRHATAFSKEESDLVAFKALRGKRVTKSDRELLPESSQQSEWSEAAIMRTKWGPKSPWVATTFNDRTLFMELGVAGQTVLHGTPQLSVLIDGEKRSQATDWTDVCWESDDDLDYLELECTLEGDWKIQRQILLAREDLFLFVADVVTGPHQAEIHYQHTLPLHDSIVIEAAEETTEATILGEKRLGRILPIALPEWKAAANDGQLRTDPLRLEMTASSSALYAPLFISLDPARRNKPITWRQLTVAEDLLAVSLEEAAAYRIQIGREQWVIYKSLGKTGNRTFLGLNQISDFYAARFHTNGETDLLIDVEPDDRD